MMLSTLMVRRKFLLAGTSLLAIGLLPRTLFAQAAKPKIGFIGAGHIGSNLARLSVGLGHKVILANSRGPETLSDLVADLGPNASAGKVEDACTGDMVVISVPLKAYKAIPADKLKDKVVIDCNNYYPDRDGKFPEIDSGSTTSSELLQAHLTDSKVVKAFNNIVYFQLATDGKPPGSKHRRALPIAGDDDGAKKTVANYIDSLGFDVVDLGPLKESKWVQPIGMPSILLGYTSNWLSKKILGYIPVYGVKQTASELKHALIHNGWQPPQ